MQIRCIETDVETWWLMGEEEKGGMGGGVLSQYPISHLLPQELEWAMKAVIAFSLYLNLLLLWPGPSHWLQISLIFVVLKFTVAVQLSRKTGGTPHSEIFWQFLHHCLDAFPECFVSLEPQNTNDGILAIGTSSSQGNKICKSGKGKQKFKDFIINCYLISFTNPSLIKL